MNDDELIHPLEVRHEAERPNTFISSLLYSRATIFYPALKLTDAMKKKLREVAESGGTDPNNPLGSSLIKAYGKTLKINMFGDFLLQPHRDILECLLAFATTIKLSDESYVAGRQLSWRDVFETIPNCRLSSTQRDAFDAFIDPTAVVLSTSMYDLATNLNLSAHQRNYEVIERRIIQLAASFIIVDELDEEQKVVDRKQVRFIQDFRFCHDESKVKNQTISRSNRTNHVFVVLDKRLLAAIRDYGYFYRLEQVKMVNYKKPSLRSFLKFSLTNKKSFLTGKKLDWLINQYIESIPVPLSNPSRMRTDLRNEVLNNAEQIERDFEIQFRCDEENVIRAYSLESD